MDFIVLDPKGHFCEWCAQNGDARLRDRSVADCDDISRIGIVASDTLDRTGGRRASGIFGESFYADLRSLSFSRRRSVVGIGGMAGAIGGMLIAEIVGHVLQWTGSYKIPFLIAASAYLVALLVIHLLSPRLEPAQIGQE